MVIKTGLTVYFQKAIIVICAKCVVTFRISCLLTMLSEAEENFNISSRQKKMENGNSFMIGCFIAGVC